ncbi:MAG: 3,4-dihydroxy-2-butanone-4-phosphate synthase [Sphingomonadaceae bacterium]|uniref:3,4-dihydroxy-2-butanone-4-phosphate synthase n=1 Tax=Thermaurantiacus sp. TaxID=2820283 RepID=UPI00298F33A4|nr:3,4-dihydroxy-2-butanone-4-phosphate synthase [Thermaurantiacus sp.]MCS6986901.1 3,4-dihydroxy-2-butanone-4-phosphate synthase [Sphingomonadaceae bacterium]MDW8415499.1 3,4-dihydroxy-2-butanone-4-phosphate synthase [Thermaurantiacus sp.]
MTVSLLDRIRQRLAETGLSKAALARACGLHPNSLRALDRPDWNPTAETLGKLEAWLDGRAQSPLVPIEQIIEEARNGRMFILVDDEDRENEGDLVIPAQMATPEAINFMARHGRGLICLALTRARVEQLQLPMMASTNGSRHETAFTVSIEAREGVTTGISAADRARTIAVAIDASQGPEALVSPGHVFPLVARDGGVLVRAGHTEASVDIARLAGLNPSAVICEIMNDDGTMARLSDLIPFARRHGLKIGTIRDLIAYRRRHDSLVACMAETTLASRFGGEWRVKLYVNKAEYAEHLVLQKGRVTPGRPTLVRMHVLSPFADILGEEGPRCGALQRAMEMIGREGEGIIVLLRDNRPDRLSRLMAEREAGVREALEQRDYGIGAQILCDLGVTEIDLITNAHRSFVGLSGYGLTVVNERPLEA